MERARELGYARSIGVSNFSASELEQVITAATIPPVVNQVNFSPQQYRRALLEACLRRNVAAEAYSPLGTGRNLSDVTVNRVGAARGADTRSGAIALGPSARTSGHHQIHPPRANPTRTRRSSTSPCQSSMAELDALDQTNGTDRALERNWW